jgi:hypothetical protein
MPRFTLLVVRPNGTEFDLEFSRKECALHYASNKVAAGYKVVLFEKSCNGTHAFEITE